MKHNQIFFWSVLFLQNAVCFAEGTEIGVNTQHEDVILSPREFEQTLKKILVTKGNIYENQLYEELSNMLKKMPKGSDMEEKIVHHIKQVQSAVLANQCVEMIKNITFAHVDKMQILSQATGVDKAVLVVLDQAENAQKLSDMHCSSKTLTDTVVQAVAYIVEMIRKPINAIDATIKKGAQKLIESMMNPTISEINAHTIKRLFENAGVSFNEIFLKYLDQFIQPIVENYTHLDHAQQYTLSQEMLRIQNRVDSGTKIGIQESSDEIKKCNLQLHQFVHNLLNMKSVPKTSFPLNVKISKASSISNLNTVHSTLVGGKEANGMVRDLEQKLSGISEDLVGIAKSLKSLKEHDKKTFQQLAQSIPEHLQRIEKAMNSIKFSLTFS